ncbi:unnamed protein product [Caenorhabditis sp. 36 PRJEB53466]|nr:unnamed protein product [Caenorhabditis sp. 36 PRJEB53466]
MKFLLICCILFAFVHFSTCLECYHGTSSFKETTISRTSCGKKQCVKIVDEAGAAKYGCDDRNECGRALEYYGKVVCPPSPHVMHGKTCCCETSLCNSVKTITNASCSLILIILMVIMMFI